jgi:hypothetical protein
MMPPQQSAEDIEEEVEEQEEEEEPSPARSGSCRQSVAAPAPARGAGGGSGSGSGGGGGGNGNGSSGGGGAGSAGPSSTPAAAASALLRKAHPGSRLLAPLSDAKKSYDVEFTSSPFGIKFRSVRRGRLSLVGMCTCLYVCMRACVHFPSLLCLRVLSGLLLSRTVSRCLALSRAVSRCLALSRAVCAVCCFSLLLLMSVAESLCVCHTAVFMLLLAVL